MIHEPSTMALAVFLFFVTAVLGISFYLGSKAKSAAGYYAAHGEIPWFVNGIAFAGDYLSAASFLGICGMIAFYGYDGFLYSIGYLAGWIVALLVIAEPLKRLGKFTFADALDNRFHSPGIRLTAAISTLVVSIFYLIPQMVGAGKLVQPLLGIASMYGVILVGVLVIMIVVTAGMVSTTWVQFIKGALLVIFCSILTGMILERGFVTKPKLLNPKFESAFIDRLEGVRKIPKTMPELEILPSEKNWPDDYLRMRNTKTGALMVFKSLSHNGQSLAGLTQIVTVKPDKSVYIDGLPKGTKEGQASIYPVGQIAKLPANEPIDENDASSQRTGPIDPVRYFSVLQESTIVTWKKSAPIIEEDKSVTTVYYPHLISGSEALTPGGSPIFQGIRTGKFTDKLNILSLMLALFAGTASLPHILIRYYTVKDQVSARKSTVVGIAAIGCFYILTLYLGLGAMTNGVLDPTDSNMAAPLLARSFGELPFAIISAIAFTTVLGTVSGLILAASGAVAHDLASGLFRMQLTDHEKVRVGKISAVVVGVIGIVLGIVFENFNVSFLVGWAFNIAASANLPSLLMLLFWRGTTKHGITASIFVGLFSSLAWVLASAESYEKVFGWPKADALVPFDQPAIVTLPLSFLVLIVVSLLTAEKANTQAMPKA
jgi:cation/acetate symporter